METLKDTQDSRKGESLLDTFGSFLVIGVYSEINNITGISPHLEIESLVSDSRCWTRVHL